ALLDREREELGRLLRVAVRRPLLDDLHLARQRLEVRDVLAELGLGRWRRRRGGRGRSLLLGGGRRRGGGDGEADHRLEHALDALLARHVARGLELVELHARLRLEPALDALLYLLDDPT
ncbi:MAG: hypothetical protein ACK559_33575, partial [bacterium]